MGMKPVGVCNVSLEDCQTDGGAGEASEMSERGFYITPAVKKQKNKSDGKWGVFRF